jgi:DNA-binding SARP family transcriptional activator/Tfp pilus assembly protein PilF
MIELRTLGTIDLVDVNGVRIDALLRRPKRLALLTYLATAHPDATYRREKLLAMFWPEIDEARARGSLRQSVHVLRQHLSADALTALGDEELSLSPSVVRCDAVEFERAIRDGRLSDAVSMYGGEFLPGFFLDDAPEFEEWLESARARLRDRAATAATQLAEQAWLADDYPECIQAARRALAIAPGDERATRSLISALDRTGDRGGAVSAYEVLAQRLNADFNVLPSAETQARVAAVRARDRAMEPIANAIEQWDALENRSIQAVSLPSEPKQVQRVTPGKRRIERYGRSVMRSALAIVVLLLSGSRGRTTSQISLPVIPAEARDAYSRARFYLEKPTEANLRHAVVLFEHALDAEPLYASAYAGLGDAYLRLGYGSYLAPSDAFPKALAAARRAIELDSLAPEAHATLAFARMYYDWDWAGAEQEFRLATRLAPGYALAHDWYAYLLIVAGRDIEARREVDLAQRLAPLSVAIATDAGFVSFYAGDLADARRRLEGALLMAPEVPVAHLWLGRLYQREGDLERARAEFEASGDLKNWVPTISAAAYVEASRGNRAAARLALVRLDSLARHQYVTPYAVALVHTALGEPDEAFRCLDRAVTERAHWLVWFNTDSRWAPLRGDPRFATLVRRVGLPHSAERCNLGDRCETLDAYPQRIGMSASR